MAPRLGNMNAIVQRVFDAFQRLSVFNEDRLKSLGSLAEFGLCFLGNGEQPQTLEKFIQV